MEINFNERKNTTRTLALAPSPDIKAIFPMFNPIALDLVRGNKASKRP